MSSRRVLDIFRLLTLSAAFVLIAALWLTVSTDTRAGAAAPATSATPIPSTPTPPNTSPFPPATPTGVRVTAVTSTSVTLAWTASTPGCCAVTGYDIVYRQAFNDVYAMQPVGNVTSYTLSSPSIGPTREYSFQISAHDDLGHRSSNSAPITVITPLTDSGPDTTPPSAPTDFTVGAAVPAGFPLTWSASTDNVGVTGYNVYSFDGLYISTLLATVTGTSYIAPTSTYRSVLYVRARDAVGNLSIASNTIGGSSTPTTPTTPTTPASPSATPPPPACRAGYTISSQWAGGFVADLKVTNTTQTPVTGWTIAFPFGGDQRIASVWNGTFTQSGAAVTLTNLNWNRIIPAGGSASVGILGRFTASNAAPTAISLNGSPCALDLLG